MSRGSAHSHISLRDHRTPRWPVVFQASELLKNRSLLQIFTNSMDHRTGPPACRSCHRIGSPRVAQGLLGRSLLVQKPTCPQGQAAPLQQKNRDAPGFNRTIGMSAAPDIWDFCLADHVGRVIASDAKMLDSLRNANLWAFRAPTAEEHIITRAEPSGAGPQLTSMTCSTQHDRNKLHRAKSARCQLL